MISEVDLRDWGTAPKKPIESKEQYEHYLKTHDWYFDYSDDHSVWMAGFKARAYLTEAARLFDPDRLLWKQHENRS